MSQLVNDSPQRFDYASGICSGGCTDIDMLWERKGNFLLIENKRFGERMSRGQQYALERLAAKPDFTVWVAYGQPPDSIVSAGELGGIQYSCDVETLRRWIQEWWVAQVWAAQVV